MSQGMIMSDGRRRAALAVLALMAVSACREETAELPPVGEDRVAVQELTCLAEGGRWGEGSRPGIFVCYRNTEDAGKACTRDGDCQGFCLARSKSCAPVTPLLGCNDVLGASGARSTVCVD